MMFFIPPYMNKRQTIHMIRKHFILFTFGLLLFAAIPLKILFPNSNSVNLEKRETKKKPSFHRINESGSLHHKIKEYTKEYEQYYNDNYVFKNRFIELYNSLKLLTKVSPLEKKVIIGQDGWLFLGNEHSNIVNETLGFSPLSQEELSAIRTSVLEKKAFCDSLGIPFFITIAPDKHSIYSEYLPLKKVNVSRLEQVDELLKQTDVNYINILDTLRIEKNRMPLYYKNDSHWNYNGAWLAYTKIFKKIQQTCPSIHYLTQENVNIKAEPFTVLDLSNMISLKVCEYIDVYYPKISPEVNTMEDEAHPGFINLVRHHAKISNFNGKIAIYGDSFTKYTYLWTSASVGETYFCQGVGGIYFDKEQIIQEKPDVVLYEIVEREIEKLK